MKKIFSKEVTIGIVTVISIALFYMGVNFLKGVNLFKPANYYYVSCTNVRDVNVSSPVFVEGFKIGLVRGIKYDYDSTDKITLEIRLEKGMKINKGSYVSVESTFLSGAELHLILNKYVTEYYKPGDLLEGRIKTGMMSAVENKLLPQVSELIPKIDSILTGLEKLVNNPALPQSLNNIANTTAQLEVSSRQLNYLLKTDVPEITSELKIVSSNISNFTGKLTKLDLEKNMNTLGAALDNIHQMSVKLNSRDNSLGLLMNDPSLYNNLNGTLENASGLLLDFKENPKRYVSFSLF